MPEAATRGVLGKKVFLKISKNSQENTCARVSFQFLFFSIFLPVLTNFSLWEEDWALVYNSMKF